MTWDTTCLLLQQGTSYHTGTVYKFKCYTLKPLCISARINYSFRFPYKKSFPLKSRVWFLLEKRPVFFHSYKQELMKSRLNSYWKWRLREHNQIEALKLCCYFWSENFHSAPKQSWNDMTRSFNEQITVIRFHGIMVGFSKLTKVLNLTKQLICFISANSWKLFIFLERDNINEFV